MHKGHCLQQASHGTHVWCWDWQYLGDIEASASMGWSDGLATKHFRGFHTQACAVIGGRLCCVWARHKGPRPCRRARCGRWRGCGDEPQARQAWCAQPPLGWRMRQHGKELRLVVEHLSASSAGQGCCGSPSGEMLYVLLMDACMARWARSCSECDRVLADAGEPEAWAAGSDGAAAAPETGASLAALASVCCSPEQESVSRRICDSYDMPWTMLFMSVSSTVFR